MRNLGRPQEALASFDQALALDPDNAAAHFNRGSTLLDLNRSQEALAAYEKAVARDPKYMSILGNIGAEWVTTSADWGQQIDAVDALDKVIRFDEFRLRNDDGT